MFCVLKMHICAFLVKYPLSLYYNLNVSLLLLCTVASAVVAISLQKQSYVSRVFSCYNCKFYEFSAKIKFLKWVLILE